jgi:glucose-6-phosphate 1-epimerase
MVEALLRHYRAGPLRFELDQHNMPRAVIATSRANAIIYFNGAHITHFQPAGHQPVLFLSSQSSFVPGKAIRGGVPIVYPWFGTNIDDPTAPIHGFARTSQWDLEDMQMFNDIVTLVFTLKNVRFKVVVDQQLRMTLDVRNPSSNPLRFEEALHTYFAVSDVRQVHVEGLGSQTFIDKTDGLKRKISPADPIRITGETDRVYVHTEGMCMIEDPIWRRRIKIEKSNSATTVLWNPWIEKARKMADFGDEEWRNMLCIETANAADNAVILAPGDTHSMSVTLSIQSLNDSMSQ